MAKVKNKRNSGLADKVHSKKKGEIHKKKLNPFEVHINREKLKVLGKKSKHDRGLPGVSRAKAIQKRKETLGTEMKLMNKTNTFIDKRIGEKDSQLSAEERMIARFAAERVRQRKGSVYNLADDELLTHRGQTLEQIEKFDDPRSDDEGDEDQAFGGLDNDFVSEGHFGGGMLSKSEKDGAKSHKDLIEQLIAESKKRKADKQKEKEQTLDLTEKLDSEWKDLQPVVFKKMRVEEPPPVKPKEPESIIDKLLKQQEKRGDDYDKMMRELKFEKRGTPSDGLKSDEKQAKEERLRLELLEKERQQRMLGEHEVTKPKAVHNAKHRSADDLDDNFELEDEKEFMLAYDKDGNPLVPEHILKDYSVPNAKPKFQDGVSDTSSDENEEESDSSDDQENIEIQNEIQENKVKSTSDRMNDSKTSSDESDEEVDFKQRIREQRKYKPSNENLLNDDDDEGSSEEESDNDNDDEVKQSKDQQSKVPMKSNDDEGSTEDESDDDNEIKQSKGKQKKGKQSIEQSKVKNKDTVSLPNDVANLAQSKEKSSSKHDKKSNDENSVEASSESDDDDEINNKTTSTVNTKQKDTETNKKVNVDDNAKTVLDSDKRILKKDNKAKGNTKNEKLNSDTVLFQNSTKRDDEDSSDEDESEEGSDEENDENSEIKDEFADFRTSDRESDSDNDAVEDSDRIESFFDLKNSEGENLKELLADKTPYQQSVTIEKLIKSYDPSLGENNKELLSRLFAHLLQYIHDIFTELNNEGDAMKAFLIFDKLAPFLYDLAHTNKVSSKKFIAELLKEKHDKYKKRLKKMPDLNTLIFFKLVSLIYPTSDFKHPVCSPSLLFMSEILTTSKFNDARSIAKGFFVTSLVLEYTVLSKRFVPSAINFLRGILYLAANTSILNPIQVVPPFKLRKDAKLLNIEQDYSKTKMAEYKMAAKDLVATKIDDDFKIRCLLTTTVMLKEFFNNCNEFQAQECIFEPHIKLYGRIETDLYPKKVANTVKEVLQYMKSSLEVKTYTPLAKESKKPKLLRLYEPDIQEVFTGSKNSKLPREQAERRRLQGKLKKEMKGALREIRRDKAYIASVKIRQKIHSDNVRKDKVKQIYKDAAIQQGEINSLKRQK